MRCRPVLRHPRSRQAAERSARRLARRADPPCEVFLRDGQVHLDDRAVVLAVALREADEPAGHTARRVARVAVSRPRRRLTDLVGERAQQADRHARMLVEEVVERVVGERDRLDDVECSRSCRARTPVDRRQLAHEAACFLHGEEDVATRWRDDRDLHDARTHCEHRATGLALSEDDLSLPIPPLPAE